MDAIPFEIDLTSLPDAADPEAVKRLIIDRFTAARCGYVMGDFGHVVAAEWRGSLLRFEYRPSEHVLEAFLWAACQDCGDPLDLGGGQAFDAPICRDCAGRDAEEASEKEYRRGESETWGEAITLIEEASEGAKEIVQLALNRLKNSMEERKKISEK